MVITPAQADLCSVADAKALFQVSRQWLDQQVLQDPLDLKPLDFTKDASLSPTFSATAAGVVLRLQGRPVGQAWARQTADHSSCLALALLKALALANEDRILAHLPAQERANAARQLSLEIELVGDTRPFTGDRIDTLAARIDNGREAMAIRAGDRWAFSLPSLQQSLNQTQLPWYTMVLMAREVGVDAGSDKKFKLPDGVVMYRADTRRLAQIAAKAPAFEVSRAMLTVPLAQITNSALDQMAVAIAAHLETRIRNSDGLSKETLETLQALGPAGEYQPALGVVAQPICAPLEQAMGAFAMARFAQMNFPEIDRAAAREFAIFTLQSLQQVVGQEKNPLDNLATMATCLLACQSLAHSTPDWADSTSKEWEKVLNAKVAAAFALNDQTDLQTWALCAAALAQQSPIEVARALDNAWQIRPVEKLLSASPWMLLAEQRVGDSSDHARAKEACELLQIMLVQSQLSRSLNPDLAADLEGGWPIIANGTSGATAQSSRPTLTMALALDPKLFSASPSTAKQNLDSLKLALRFLKQLQVDQSGCYAFRDPAKSIGGIRAAPWDSNQPLGANATTLLAVLESRGLLANEPTSK
jgi:hypothetical protein